MLIAFQNLIIKLISNIDNFSFLFFSFFCLKLWLEILVKGVKI